MFVRFRTRRRRLQASLITTHRIAGKVRHEHIAGLGSVDAGLAVADRVAFWQRLHERLAQLSNRLGATAQAKVLGEVHARIPMVTIEEIQTLQLENAEADERFWQGFAEMQTERAGGNDQLAATAQQVASEARTQAENAAKKADAAKDRVARLKRGEAVTGGLGKPIDPERLSREAGMTTADIKRARQTRAIADLGGEAAFEELLNETNKRHRAAETAARRTVLRRLVVQALREGRIKP